MDEKYKVSIIVPIFNAEKYLDKCLKSIVQQTYENLEIILINDGSKDNSLNICKKYEKKDKRIKLINKKNEGVSIARNCGLDISTGDYISFVDSDDYIEKDMIYKLLETIIINNSNISVCNVIYDNGNDYLLKIPPLVEKKYVGKVKCLELNMQSNYFGYMCNKLYESSLFKNVRFNNNIFYSEDELLNLQIIDDNKNISISIISDKLYHYVQHDDSAINKSLNIKNYSVLDALSKEIEIFENNNLNTTFIKYDYICKFIKYNILSKKNKIDIDKKNMKKYRDNYNNYCSTIELKKLNFKSKIKFIVITKFKLIYVVKIYLENQKI